MAFDTAAAKQAGYSDTEIAEFLGKQKNFDTAAAISAGYSPAELITHLGGAPSKERTWGEAATDIGAGAVSGLGSLVQLPGQLYGLTTGDFEKTGLLGLGERISKAGDEMKSTGLQAREAARAQAIAEAEKKGQLSAFGTAFGQTVSDPALLSSFLAEQIPQLLIPGGAAAGAGRLALGKAAALGVGEAAAKEAAIKAGTRAAVGAGAVQQGADVGAQAYEDIYKKLTDQGMAPPDAAARAINLARAAGVSGAVISLLAQRLPGAQALESALAGKVGAAGVLAGAGKGALGEAVSEAVEEGGGKFTQNLAMRDIDPTQALMQGVGATAGQAAVGGVGMGGGAGAISGMRGAPTAVPTQVPGAPTDVEAAAQAARVQRQQEQRLAAQGISSREGEKILGAEETVAAKAAKEQEALAQKTMQDDYAQRRAEREAELKEAFPADYSDVMDKAERYGVLATELASLEGERKTPEVRNRINTIQARMANVAAEDDRIPNEALRMQQVQRAAAKKAGFPAEKAARIFSNPALSQVEMREALPEGTLPAQTDLFGNPVRPTVAQPEGLNTVAEAELPLTSDVLRDAGIAPTPKELEAAGQQRLPLNRTPMGQPTSPLRETTPTTTQAPVVPLPIVEPDLAEPMQPGAITATEVRQFGTMSKANRQWLVDNVEGRTPEQVRDMLDADPTIMAAVPKGLQVVLKEIVANAAPKETPSVQPQNSVSTPTEPIIRPRRGKSSVAVSGKPAGLKPVETGNAATPSTEESTPPVGRGLVPSGQPASEGVASEVAGKPALDEEAERQAEAQAVLDALAKVKADRQARDKERASQNAQSLVAKTPAPAPTPAKAETTPAKAETTPAKAETTPAKAETTPAGSPFDILARINKNKKAAAEKPTPAKEAENTPDKEKPTPIKEEVPPPSKAALANVPLTPAEVSKLEDHYGLGRTSPQFWAKLQDDVVALTNKGLKAVDVAVRKIIQKIASGVMAAAIVFNPAMVKTDFDFNLPQAFRTTVTTQVKADVPANAKTKMSVLAQSVYESMAPTARASGKGFIIADKPNGMLHVFNADGSMLVQDAALYGKDIGDTEGKVSSLEGGKKITPAGNYTLRAAANADYAGGKLLQLVETKDTNNAYIAVHAAYLGDPKEQRLQRLASPGAEGKRISYGCVNTTHDTFLKSILPNIDSLNGGMIFVLPDAQTDTAAMFPTKTEATTFTGTEKNTKSDSGQDIAAKEADRPPEAAKEKIGETPLKGRASAAVAKGQSLDSLKSEIASGKGILASALRRALASGKVVLEERHPDGGIGGYFDGSKVTLYADGIPAGQAAAVALHEIGAHMGFKSLFGDRVYNNVIQRIQDLANSKSASEDRALAQRALNRIPESDKKRGAEVYGDETLAYFIEEALLAQQAGTLPKAGAVRALLNNIRLAMIAAVNRVFGSRLGVADFDTQDILSMAEGAFFRESFGAPKAATPSEPDVGRASKTAAKILGVDALDPSTQASIDAIHAAMPKLDPNEANNVVEQAVKGVADANKKSGIVATFRQAAADKFSTVESKVSQMFSKGGRDAFDNLNPMVLVRQAEDGARIVLDFFRMGGIGLTKDGIVSTRQEKQSLASALSKVADLGKASNLTYDKAKEYVSTVLEGHRLASIRDSNNLLEREAVYLETLGKNAAADSKRAEKIVMHMTTAEINTLEAAYQKSKAIQNIQDDLNATRTSAIEFMVATGRISKEQGAFWNDNTAYVPFSRVFEDTPITKMKQGPGISVLHNIPEMKGSLGRPVKNVLDAYANRLGYMVEESMKNHAAVNLLSTMELGGYAKKLRGIEQATNKNLVVPRLYIEGKPALFEVQNEYDLLAFQQAPELTNWLIKGLASTSRILRTTITAMPPFALKQVLDDAQRAMFTSGVKRPVVVGMKTLYNLPRTFFGEVTGRKSPLVRQLEAVGVIGDFDSNRFQPANDLEAEIGAKKRGTAKQILHRLEQFTKASDLSARLAVYEETLLDTGGKKQANGDITGGDIVLAQTRARELINFSRKGTSGSMRIATQVIPFFNAYAQGMDVLYRAASGIDSTSSIERSAARKMFWSRVGLMSAMGLLYALSMSDDEGYKNASDDVRDNNWLLPDGIKLPVPRELGFIFKTIPERVVEYYRRSGTDEEQSALKALSGLAKSAVSAYGLPNTIPSTVRPILENLTNYSFFGQRELEPKSVQGQEPGYRSTSATSELAKALGESANISPIKIDNLIRGMFGIVGSTTLMATDAVINPTRPDRPLYQLPFASIFLYDTIGGKAKTEFYDLRERVGSAVSTYNDLQKDDPTKAEAYGEKNEALLSAAPIVNNYLRQLNDLGRMRRLLEQSTDEVLGMTGTERRKEIDEIRRAENETVAFVREMETELRKP
jgi:hypothetical protein